MALNKVINPKKLIQNLVGEDNGFHNHDLDEEIQVCMMSTKDEEAYVHFRITSVDENTIYIRPRGISSNKKRFTTKLPKCKTWKRNQKQIMEKINGHQ
jgi:hypothetical protein